MSNPVQSLFGITVPHGKLLECIASLEEGLRCVKETAFHSVLGSDFLHHTDAVAQFISEFYRSASQDHSIGAMYFEMNGFEINPGRWFFKQLRVPDRSEY